MNCLDMGYIRNFMKMTKLPEEAYIILDSASRQINDDKNACGIFAEQKNAVMNEGYPLDKALDKIGSLQDRLLISTYTLQFIFLIGCTDILMGRYLESGYGEKLFWETMQDWRYKLIECYDCKGIYGIFCGTWYDGFLNMTRFTLGRFQYEQIEYYCDTYEKHGVKIEKGDPIINFHIPSSGQPLDKTTRYDSYYKAYEFFKLKEKGQPLVLMCNSWLLYSDHAKFLKPGSNILYFLQDFDIIESHSVDEFDDAWRIWNKDADLPVEQRPTDTSLRKAVSDRLVTGGKMGAGTGIIVFDGKNVLTRHGDN